MRSLVFILIPAFLTGCDTKHYDVDDVVYADNFAYLSCKGVRDPSLVASSIRQLNIDQNLLVEETRSIAGAEGALVVASAANDLQSGGTQITLFFEDGAAEVSVYANKAVEPNSKDRELLSSVLEASGLNECKAIIGE